ncbi:MAG: hypothetical protein M3302_06470 [Actinomycetota bacterium]|nr:hypothetical protein [Actinomycetota bacterium]
MNVISLLPQYQHHAVAAALDCVDVDEAVDVGQGVLHDRVWYEPDA